MKHPHNNAIRFLVTASSLSATLLISACVQDQQQPVIEKSGINSPQVISPVKKEHDVATLPVKTDAAKMATVVNQAEMMAIQPMMDSQLSSSRVMPSRQMKLAAPGSMSGLGMTHEMIVNPGWSSPVNRDRYQPLAENPVKRVSEDPVSTFSIDVDTGAYSLVRAHLNRGSLPPSDAVRIEEMINYFEYQYPLPESREQPFSVSTEIASTPWNANTQLVQVGLKGFEVDNESRPDANLVFLIDVSGSMNAPDKLPLLKQAFKMLQKQLTANDSISIVVYAGSSGVVLEPTAGDQKADIVAALDQLSAGGSTHGSAGIELAYNMAQQAFKKDGINRVILATDGDFNVGTVNHEALLDLIEHKKQQGISLTTLGFGHGNYNDQLMEQLADHGDGNYAYIDNLNEARKTLVQQVSSTLEIIAKDVKIQIEWNPATVAEYRLVGYQNRILNREDFNNDKVDAGEIGAGHTVTALYEITLAGSSEQRIDALRYQRDGKTIRDSGSSELGWLKLRYKQPKAQVSQLIEQPIRQPVSIPAMQQASENLRFASAVAAFGDRLRGGVNLQTFDYDDILQQARLARGKDLHGYRGEFIRLVELSESLDSNG